MKLLLVVSVKSGKNVENRFKNLMFNDVGLDRHVQNTQEPEY